MPPQAWGVDDVRTSLWSDDCRDPPDALPQPGFHEACSSVLLDSALQFILDDVDFDEPPLGVRHARLAHPVQRASAQHCWIMPPHCILSLCPACIFACAGKRVTAAVLGFGAVGPAEPGHRRRTLQARGGSYAVSAHNGFT